MIKNKRLNRKLSRRLVKAMENFRRRYECESRKEARWLNRANLIQWDFVKAKGRKRRHDCTLGIFAREDRVEHEVTEGDLMIAHCYRGKYSVISSVIRF